MGNYITRTTLEQRMKAPVLYRLLKDIPANELQDAVDQIIARAESLIDGYSDRLYITPLTVSGLVQEWAFVVSEYEIYKYGQGNDVPAKYKYSYEKVEKELADVGKGLLIPPGAIKRLKGSSIAIKSDLSLFSEKAWYNYKDNYRDTMS